MLPHNLGLMHFIKHDITVSSCYLKLKNEEEE